MTIANDTPGARLFEARTKSGLSRRELANRLGCAVSAVSNHEHGINGIRAPTAAAYADQLGTTPQWLLYGEEGGAAAPPVRGGSPISMVSLGNGKARLTMNTVVPFGVALQILGLVESEGQE